MSETAMPPAAIRSYDLLAQQAPALTRMPTLGPTVDRINHRFSRYLRAALLQHLRRGVDLYPGAVELIKHRELLERLSAPSYCSLVSMRPLRGSILVMFDAALVVTIVESRFGGSGRFPVTMTGREFTPFELKSMRRVIEMTLEQYALAWQPLGSSKPEITRQETNPQFAAFATADDLVLVTTFDIQIDHGRGKLLTCIPYAGIESINDTVISGVHEGSFEPDSRWADALAAGVEQASITLNVELGNIEISVSDLVAIEPGTVFEMDRPESLTVESGGVPLFRGRWGRVGRKVGIRIEERLMPQIDALALDGLRAHHGGTDD